MTRALPSPRLAAAVALLALAALPAGAQARASSPSTRRAPARLAATTSSTPARALWPRAALRIANVGKHRGTVLLSAVDAATGVTTGAVYGASPRGPVGVGAWTTLSRYRVRLRPRSSTIEH
jgi:hypothetical protein